LDPWLPLKLILPLASRAVNHKTEKTPGTFFRLQEPTEILREAMRKTFKDPGFPGAYREATGDDATPVMPEELQRIVTEAPRDREVVALFNKMAGPQPLPER